MASFETLVFEIIAKDAQASAAFDRFRRTVDQTSSSVDKNTSSLDRSHGSWSKLATSAQGAGTSLGGMITPMSGAIAAGVALAPVIVTVGAGLAGLGLAAYETLSPLLKAAQVTGGLQANLAKLNPEQRAAAASLLTLQGDYRKFEAALAPVVLKDFSIAVGLAGRLLGDLAPVAKATGIAVGGLLNRVDTEFRSNTWQQFFGFMAKTAGPDIRLLGDAFINLMNALPPLLEALQPVAKAFLLITADATKTVNLVAHFPQIFDPAGQSLGTFGQHTAKSAGSLDLFSQKGSKAIQAAAGANVPVSLFGRAMGFLGEMAKGTGLLLGSATGKIKGTGDAAAVAAPKIKTLWQQVVDLTTAESKSLDTQLAYSNALITQHNDAKNLADALKASHDRIGLQTQQQRNSFAAAQTFIGDLENTAKQAIASGKGIGTQISNIRNSLPLLESAKSHNRSYWQEVRTLVGWLDKLKTEKVNIIVHGLGSWNVSSLPGSGEPARHGGAAGWRVPGYGGGDRIPVLVEGGETIVPKHLTAMVAPLMKAYGVPGFAAGGVVGSYGDGIGGLGTWLRSENTATIRAIALSVAASFAAALRAAIPAAGGPGGGSASANAALARSMFPQWSMPPLWNAWNYVAMRESGWNQFARNPSSGAYGIAQALPPTKYPFAGQAGGGSNPAAQISWMAGYMASVYGGPIGAAQHEAAFNWYGDGFHGWFDKPTVIGVGERGRERVDIGGGGNNYHITVNVAPGGNLREAGRQMVEAIRSFEKTSGANWRK